VNYAGGSTTVPLTVTRAAAAITWPAPSSIVYGMPLGSAQLNAVANVAGTFDYSPASGSMLTAGSQLLTVSFTPADSANYSPASVTVPLNVAKAPLRIAANGATKPFGAPLPAFSVTAEGFMSGDSLASLSGALTFTTGATAASAVGAYPVTPEGLSASNYTVGFVSGMLTVVRAGTVTSASSTPSPSGINERVTFVARLAVVAPGAGAPTGIVQFFDGATLLGSSNVVDGVASLTTNGLAAGSHSISMTYSGDASFNASSNAFIHTVKSSAASSTTALSSSDNLSILGQNVWFTATVTSPAGGVSGVVEFYDGATPIGTVTVVSGSARLSTSGLDLGGHAISARYLGNSALPPSTSGALAQTVQSSGDKTRSSSAALAASPSPAQLGSEVTLAATVTGSQRQAPAGSVLFMVNGEVIGTVGTTVTGSVTAQAVLRTNALSHGTHNVAIVYLGDGTYRASTATATVTVN
jgi:hypothetical protein